jgi:hypothetical protein
MYAVAMAALLFAALVSPAGLVAAFALSYTALVGGTWSMFHGFRRLSALSFWLVGVLSNIFCAALCIHRLNMVGAALMLLGCVVSFPIVFGAGAAWATAVTRRSARPKYAPILAWLIVLVLAVLPLTMLLTRWPFHLAFRASRRALDRLADRVAAGHVIASAEWAGLYRVIESDLDPPSGNVGLIIDPDLSGRSGFLRLGTAPSKATARWTAPFYNTSGDLNLGDRWWYANED